MAGPFRRTKSSGFSAAPGSLGCWLRLPSQCKDVDQPCYALIQDLKRRGLLGETLVIWGGEFGRTIYS